MDFTNTFNQKYIEIAMRSEIHPIMKVELLDYNDGVVGEITQDIISNYGSIAINYKQGVRRSCSLTLSNIDRKYLPNPNSGMFWINSKFKVYTGLKDIYTGDNYWFSQGVFITTRPSAPRSLSNVTITIEGVDKFGIFGSETNYNQLEGTYKVEKGKNAAQVIRDILLLDLGNGHVIDWIDPIIDPKMLTEVLPYDIIKSPKQYLGDILIEIANVLGCDIFYDTDGRLNIISGTADFSFTQQSAIWDYTDVLPEYSNANVAADYVNAINAVKITGTNINDKVYEYTAENRNPMSPTRIDLIGRKMMVIDSANVFNAERARDLAEYRLNQHSIVQLQVDFNSSWLPHLDVNRVVNITDSYYNYYQQRFIISSLNIPLSLTSQIGISASNIAQLPYYELLNG